MNEKTYYLDLPTVVHFLRGKSAHLTTRLLIGRISATGSVSLVNGAVTACFVTWAGGRLEGDDAYERLKGQAEWNVVFEQGPVSPHNLAPALPDVPNAPGERVGSRKSGISPPIIPVPKVPPRKALALLDRFPPQQRLLLRTVYTLIDGHRTVEQIKGQLSLPAEVVEQTLNALQQLDLISSR